MDRILEPCRHRPHSHGQVIVRFSEECRSESSGAWRHNGRLCKVRNRPCFAPTLHEKCQSVFVPTISFAAHPLGAGARGRIIPVHLHRRPSREKEVLLPDHGQSYTTRLWKSCRPSRQNPRDQRRCHCFFQARHAGCTIHVRHAHSMPWS